MQAVKKQHSWGVAEVILLLSIAILVIVVVVPVALIFFNAFFVDGQFNVADLVKTLSEGETYQALLNSLFIASGVQASRLTAVGHADNIPVAPNETPEGRARNRRVAVTILSGIPETVTEVPTPPVAPAPAPAPAN